MYIQNVTSVDCSVFQPFSSLGTSQKFIIIWRNLNAPYSTIYSIFRESSKELAEPLGSAEPRLKNKLPISCSLKGFICSTCTHTYTQAHTGTHTAEILCTIMRHVLSGTDAPTPTTGKSTWHTLSQTQLFNNGKSRKRLWRKKEAGVENRNSERRKLDIPRNSSFFSTYKEQLASFITYAYLGA